MPSDAWLTRTNAIHRTLMTATRGKLGWTIAKMPVLKLTTTGRRTGTKRTVILTSPIQVGDSLVIVASKGGEDTHPAWLLNLRDDPAVEVAQRGNPTTPMTARILDNDERDELWPQVTAAYAGYGKYQTRTDRVIPLVMLEPGGA